MPTDRLYQSLEVARLPELDNLDLHATALVQGPIVRRTGIHRETGRQYFVQHLVDGMPDPGNASPIHVAWQRSRELPAGVTLDGTELLESRLGPVLVSPSEGFISLHAILAQARSLSCADALQIAAATARALSRTHAAGIIHNGLNPRNILLDENHTRAVLVGFENSFRFREGEFAQHAKFTDTYQLAYTPPESTGRINLLVDARADIYSLGAVLYEMVAGAPPFTASHASELMHAHLASVPRKLSLSDPSVPRMLDSIVARLLAKHPAERYRSAAGLAHDLELLSEHMRLGDESGFEPAQADVSQDFEIPVKLYGRGNELSELVRACREASQGALQALVVRGYSGIGKSALVAEAQRSTVGAQTWFGTGKFDQYRHDVPYLAWSQALTAIVQQLLSAPTPLLERVRSALLERIGNSGAILLDIVPQLEVVLGPQPALADVDPEHAEHRVVHVVGNFLAALRDSGQTTILFLDDLHWADRASLKLFEGVLGSSQLGSLLILGAYRTNAVSEGHPLAATLARAAESGRLRELTLGRLRLGDVCDLMSETLNCDVSRVSSFAALVDAKTDGNPFFVRQFLSDLHRKRLVRFDLDLARWVWDVDAISAESMTDNVVELLTRVILTWPLETQRTLAAAACMGNDFDLQVLGDALECPLDRLKAELLPALKMQLVLPLEPLLATNERYRFQHDRVQQSAYALIGERERGDIHLRLARQMLVRALAGDGSADEFYTQLMDHLGACLTQLNDAQDRVDFARACLSAVVRARVSMAVEPALKSIELGLRLTRNLEDTAQVNAGDLRGELLVNGVELAYTSGNHELAREYGTEALHRVTDLVQRARVHNALIGIGISERRHADSVQYGLQVLQDELQVQVPRQAGRLRAMAAVLAVRLRLGRRRPADLLELPASTEPKVQAAMGILMKCATNAYWGSPTLVPPIAAQMIDLSLRHGTSGLSGYGCALYGMILSGAGAMPRLGFEFGKVGMDMLTRHEADHLRGKTGLLFHGFIRHALEPLRDCARDTLALYHPAMEFGDVENACYCVNVAYFSDLLSGRRLEEIEIEYADYLAVLLESNQTQLAFTARCWMQVFANIREPVTTARLAGDLADWSEHAPGMLADSGALMETALIASGAGWLAFLKGAWDVAAEQFDIVYQRQSASTGQGFLKPCLAMYAIVLARRGGQAARLRKLAGKLRVWTQNNPHDFQVFATLLEAEKKFAGNRVAEAALLWIRAAEEARDTGFGYLEAWALKRAADAHRDLGHVLHARHINQEALLSWRRHGAEGCISAWWGDAGFSGQTTSLGELDFTSILEAIRVVAENMQPATLLRRTLELAIQVTGGRKATLLTGGEARSVMAVAEIDEAGLLRFDSEVRSFDGLPISLVDYIVRMRRNVVVSDALSHDWLSRDKYVIREQVRSLLGVPLLRHGNLVGIAVIENNLGAGLFAERQVRLLESIVGQAAVSLENARLFAEQEQRAEAYKRFVPQRFLESLGREDLVDVNLGEARQQDVTVMFADISGFTLLAEQLGPEQSFTLLNDYFAQMTPAISSYGGFVDEFMGDGIKALFLDGAEGAVKAAVDMQRRVAAQAFVHQRRATIGVGVHSGTALLGTVGAEERMSTKAIGDTVNVAARVESVAKRLGALVLVTEETLAEMPQHKFTTRFAGRMQLVGRQQPVALHEVLDARPQIELERIAANLDLWERAVALFLVRDFVGACADLEAFLQAVPDDTMTARFIQRCKQLEPATLPSDWQGVEILDYK